jgi:cbb3-type cytochrome oxidase subunit 3
MISILPHFLKIDYCQASLTAKKEWLTYILWECITPGWTAVFLILSAVWYYMKGRESRNAGDYSKQFAYNDAANAFLLWGIFNGVVYFSIVATQRGFLGYST